MTDEECIATAMLHGAKFWPPQSELDKDRQRINEKFRLPIVWAIDVGFHESMECVYPDGRIATSTGESVASAARAYCKRHGLLPEVTDADT